VQRFVAVSVAVVLLTGQLIFTTSARAATCVSSVGPGIPPPTAVPSGIPGFHASWYGQSGYPTLCPGDKATSVVAYFNSGSAGWIRGVMGQAAYLGTWGPQPGQDLPSPLGGDGTNGSPATGWPRYNRIAQQPAEWVGPNQVAWFQFQVQAPTTPGYYKLYLRPLIEGTTWMEDYGVYWSVTVLNQDGTLPPPPLRDAEPGCRNWPAGMGVMSKLPLPTQLCLLPYDQKPDLCQSGPSEGGCYLGKGTYWPGVDWPRNTVWVKSGWTAAQDLHVTTHEACHAHQNRVASDLGYSDWPLWERSQEAFEFQSSWEAFKSQYPQGYVAWGERGMALENAAETCAGWYNPYLQYNTASYPPLAQWAQKWLPK